MLCVFVGIMRLRGITIPDVVRSQMSWVIGDDASWLASHESRDKHDNC